jgi:hypothetical protein
MFLVGERDWRAFQPAVALDVDCVMAIDEDVRDRWVLHQRFERPEPERLIEHLVDQPLALLAVDQRRAALAQFIGNPADFESQLFLAHAGEGRQIHVHHQLAMQMPFQPPQLIAGPQLVGHNNVRARRRGAVAFAVGQIFGDAPTHGANLLQLPTASSSAVPRSVRRRSMANLASSAMLWAAFVLGYFSTTGIPVLLAALNVLGSSAMK